MNREIYIDRLEKDLIGPLEGFEEQISEKPSDKYLTGILYPLNTKNTEYDDEGDLAANSNDEEESFSEEIDITKTYKPASMGLSFKIKKETKNFSIKVEFGKYLLNNDQEEGLKEWHREQFSFQQDILIKEYKNEVIEIEKNIYLHILSLKKEENFIFTTSLLNRNKTTFESDQKEIVEKSIFQTKLQVTCDNGFLTKNIKKLNYSYDEKINDLIYRSYGSYVSGHTCSGFHKFNKNNYIISSTWLPVFEHKAPSPEGDDIFKNYLNKINHKNFTTNLLYSDVNDDIFSILSVIPNAYKDWLQQQEGRIKELSEEHTLVAQKNIEIGRQDMNRMIQGINFLKDNQQAFEAFKLAQRSLQLQFTWSNPSLGNLNWRPFQLAFFLMNIAYLGNPDHKDRDIMDLLWFPTGGGKTEAYLLIIAFILFFKRLDKKTEIKCGLTVLMRYTLRTLTVDQFKRASAVILACEHIRKGNINNDPNEEISIGLWVGSRTTPNHEGQESDYEGVSAKQLEECPCCKKILSPHPKHKSTLFYCQNDECTIHHIQPFPVYTIDTKIYEKKPSLLIATIDKFAQIVRNNQLPELFQNFDPELIIQDELHLISGPMGSLSGMYEFAIDKIFSQKKKIKVIGSTATIKRADEQILSLYDRTTSQFPPPIIDYDNSCFSKVDYEKNGRVYLGVTTSGRSAKFLLQFIIASFLQSIKDKKLNQEVLDLYSTIVLYFNSLRELGGSIALVEDDVRKTLQVIKDRRDEEERNISSVQELTSRRTSTEITETMRLLNKKVTSSDFVDVLLATNMLSVGVDIPRLGLMIVNGFPKSVAEYIQSTSRVGRRNPGIVLTLFNNNKVRDKSIFESFHSVHSTLYKSVEVSSVTPFAPRSRDKSLHAPIVAIYKILYGKEAKVRINEKISKEIINNIINPFIERVFRIDPKEAENTKKESLLFIERWLIRSAEKKRLFFWNPSYPKNSLLVSAEQYATKPSNMSFGGYARDDSKEPVGQPYPTPNSMRDVEPGVAFKLQEV